VPNSLGVNVNVNTESCAIPSAGNEHGNAPSLAGKVNAKDSDPACPCDDEDSAVSAGKVKKPGGAEPDRPSSDSSCFTAKASENENDAPRQHSHESRMHRRAGLAAREK
jgi:hypothetical protein